MGSRRGSALAALAAVLLAGCTSGSPETASVASASGSDVQAVGQFLHCELVATDGFPTFDQEGMLGASAQAAVDALADSLGLHQAASQQRTLPGRSPSSADVWPLFNPDGSGYGTASVTRTDAGQWAAYVDHWCSEVVPLPLATQVSPPPTVSAPLEVPPAPGPGSDTIALATYERDAGRRSTSGNFTLDPPGPFVVRSQCLADRAGVAIQYTVLADGEDVGTGEVRCDGSLFVDSVVLPGGAAIQYHVDLESEAFDQVIEAYAALVPE